MGRPITAGSRAAGFCENTVWLRLSLEGEVRGPPFSEERFCLFMASVPAHLYLIKEYVFFGGKLVFVNHVGGKTEWGDSTAKDRRRIASAGWQVDEKP